MKKILLKFVTRFEKVLLKNGWVLIKNPRLLKRDRTIDLSYKGWDYIRYSSLELCAYEINQKKLKGAIAEIGVFQGEFAAKISEIFPDRAFYLYDTFEGFHPKDVIIENQNKFSAVERDFSDTSVEKVLEKIGSPNSCIVRKGYFPDTIESEENESFVFVSLDPDLYKPIYDGLNFFYPRLVPGGYIFVHDFNNNEYAGARKAVTQFCSENKVNFFPLSDIAGTAIITK